MKGHVSDAARWLDKAVVMLEPSYKKLLLTCAPSQGPQLRYMVAGNLRDHDGRSWRFPGRSPMNGVSVTRSCCPILERPANGASQPRTRYCRIITSGYWRPWK